MLKKLLFVTALGFLLGLAQASADSVPAPGRVKGRIVVARVQGHVDAVSKPDGQRRVLHDGDTVSEQTEIVTAPGANIILAFSNGATLNVGADSTLDIEQFEQDPFGADQKVSNMKQEPGTSTTRLNLTKGELVGKVVHLNVDRDSEFTIQTPVGAAGIRGTTFRIVFRPGPNGSAFFSAITTEGRVLFSGADTAPLGVPPGKEVKGTFDVGTRKSSSPIVLTNVSAADAAAIAAAVAEIDNAILDLMFGPLGNNGPNGSGGGGGYVPPSASPNNLPSLPAIPAPATTPGAGVP